jgi:hypothetical protein
VNQEPKSKRAFFARHPFISILKADAGGRALRQSLSPDKVSVIIVKKRVFHQAASAGIARN